MTRGESALADESRRPWKQEKRVGALKGRGSELSELPPPPPLPGRMILLNQWPGVAQKPRHPWLFSNLPAGTKFKRIYRHGILKLATFTFDANPARHHFCRQQLFFYPSSQIAQFLQISPSAATRLQRRFNKNLLINPQQEEFLFQIFV